MEICSICDSGLLVVKMSSAGREAFCSSCRRIVESASLGFKFAGESEIEECTSGNKRGFKGPGKKARCFTFDEGDKEAEAKAKQKAKDSAYAYQHARGASKIVNATGYFTGGPASMSPPPTASNPMAPGAQPNPLPPTSMPGKSPMGVGGTGLNGEVPAAPGGVQMGELNGANPLNSGTTASKISPRLAELISREEMGIPWCTSHNCKADECNHMHETH